MALELLAQQYLPISPRHVSLLVNDGGSPAAVVAVSGAYDPKNRVFFLEWDDPMVAGSFRVTHAPVPGRGVNGLSLVLSQDGVVHCVVQSFDLESGYENVSTYVLRRTETSDSSDSDECPCDENEEHGSAGGTAAVKYQCLPKPVEDDGRSWTAALRLCRHGSVSSGKRGRIAVACGGERGQPNALKTLCLTGTRVSVYQTMELPVLSMFPVLELREVDGDSSSLLALCHHAVLEMDLRLRQQDSVVRAWKWTPRDPLTALAVKDNAIVAGTEEGVVVLWDLRLAAPRDRSAPAVDHSAPHGAPTTGLHMPHSTNLLSCHADGSILVWERERQAGANIGEFSGTSNGDFCFRPRHVAALPPVYVGSPGCVALAAEEHLSVIADESGTVSIFATL
ncbi:hypothetical protein ERJ75_000681700 [Trypanosoma vivax]|uniref:Guanine nucleotide-binding protein subunit beta-like protein n=1 Tax=Trypanosoma vivax (strain Y486) TaxID=1055687 RepID=G0U5N0_TRYVY|nr:hypothetical protein ERJ75_000681700 [Trypanosoma vivax]CCC51181.1 conserved hypothetical protein [Trypanosoma vivax Y486]